MILFVAAAIAAAAPAAACPDVVTPEALVCRALDAQHGDNPEGAAQNFEEAAKASPDKDPATARLWAAAGNMWLAADQPGKAAFALDRARAAEAQGGRSGNALHKSPAFAPIASPESLAVVGSQ